MREYWTSVFILLVAGTVAIYLLPPAMPSYGALPRGSTLLRSITMAQLAPVTAIFDQAIWLLDKVAAR